MLRDLLQEPSVREVLELRSPFGFMALHGGSQDRVTDEIAAAAAQASESSLYAVVMPPQLRWHVPSAKFLPRDSDQLTRFLEHARIVISIHGYGCDGLYLDGPWNLESSMDRDLSRSRVILVGGANRAAASEVARRLRGAVPNYDVRVADAAFPGSGTHPNNPVNRAKQWGVQIELPPAIRGLGPAPGLVEDFDHLVETLSGIARRTPVVGDLESG